MAGINRSKVITGGIVAGIVFWGGNLIASLTLLRADMEAMFQARNIDMAAMETTGAFVSWVITDLLFGLLAVWTYAAIRPRFGPGPRTAAVAGLAVFVAAILVMYSFSSTGMIPATVFVKFFFIWLVVMVVGTMAGAKFYTER
jgi:hypothetical protein